MMRWVIFGERVPPEGGETGSGSEGYRRRLASLAAASLGQVWPLSLRMRETLERLLLLPAGC